MRASALESGREPDAVRVMAAAPAHVGDLAECRDRVRWFPALVGNHVVDLVNRYRGDDLPAGLTTYVRTRTGYDYLHHAEVGSSNAEFVTDETVDRFCLVGPVEDRRRRGRPQFSGRLATGACLAPAARHWTPVGRSRASSRSARLV